MSQCFYVGKRVNDGAYCVETCNQAFEQGLAAIEEAVETQLGAALKR